MAIKHNLRALLFHFFGENQIGSLENRKYYIYAICKKRTQQNAK